MQPLQHQLNRQDGTLKSSNSILYSQKFLMAANVTYSWPQIFADYNLKCATFSPPFRPVLVEGYTGCLNVRLHEPCKGTAVLWCCDFE